MPSYFRYGSVVHPITYHLDISIIYIIYIYIKLPGSARPMPGRKFRKNQMAIRNQWPIGKFFRCRSNEVLKLGGASTNEQMDVEMRMQWHEKNSCTADWMNQWTNELMKQWMNESVNQWTSESMNQWIFPTSSSKSAPTFSVFNIWKCKSSSLKCKSSSRHSLVHILPTSSSKSAPPGMPFCFIFKCKPSSRYSLVYILPTSSFKVLRTPQNFNVLKWKSGSRQLSQIEARNRGNRHPT